jgi:hypothetical protein
MIIIIIIYKKSVIIPPDAILLSVQIIEETLRIEMSEAGPEGLYGTGLELSNALTQ